MMNMKGVLELNAGSWDQEVLKSDKLTLVDFWHNHCPWCTKLNPIIDEVAEEYEGRVKFAKLNVLESPGQPRNSPSLRGDEHTDIDVFLRR